MIKYYTELPTLNPIGLVVQALFRSFPIFVFFLVPLLPAAGLAETGPSDPSEKKVLVLGMDGLDPKILVKMIRQGKLPHFQKLAKEGTLQPLQTTNPPQSPVAWSGFSSGKNPGHHNVFDFIVRNPATYLPEMGMTQTSHPKNSLKKWLSPILGPDLLSRRKGPAFWDDLSQSNIHNIILRCPMTFPATHVNGRMLSGMGTPDIKGTQGLFSYYTTEPLGDEDVHGRVYHVEWKDDVIRTDISGPKKKDDGTTIEVMVPLYINRVQHNSIQIHSQDTSHTLKVGHWSPWFRLSFKLGFAQRVSGICRFYLTSLEPHLKLYATPVNLDPEDPAFQISYPASYSRKVAKKIGLYTTQGMPFTTWALEEDRLSEEAFLEMAYDILDEKLNHLWLELDQFKSGFFFHYIGLPDIVSHMFWRYRDPAHPHQGKNKNPEVKDAVSRAYEKMDQIIGDLRAKLDDDTWLMVISDHGFTSFRRAVHINSWLRKYGYLFLLDEATVGKELLANVDWSRTKAYSVGFGGIYINQQGREAYGVVEPGVETQKLKRQLRRKLQLWKDKSQPVIRKVYDGSKIYQGPHSTNGPDLFIGFNKGYRASWQTGLGAAPEKTIETNRKKWSGDHLVDPYFVPGVFLSNRPLKKRNLHITDISTLIRDTFDVTPHETKQ